MCTPNRFSSHAIVVKPKKPPLNDNKRKQKKQTQAECDKTVGHVPDSLTEFFSHYKWLLRKYFQSLGLLKATTELL